jgi:Predicted oxidoreductase
MLQPHAIAPQGPAFSPLIAGYWRLMEWGMTPQQLVQFIEHHLALGITTVDHADIYGDYRCEAAFGEALRLAPQLRQQLQIVTKCGIATRAKPDIKSVTTSPKPATSCTVRKIRCATLPPIISICC